MRKANRVITDIFLTMLTVIVVLFAVFPLYWLISTSMKSEAEAFAMPFKWVFTPDFSSYVSLLTNPEFQKVVTNSLVVSVVTTLLALFFGIPTGYALARTRSRFGHSMGVGIIIARMVPPMAIIIPFYVIFNYLSLTDTYLALILIYLTTMLPFVAWLMMGFFKGVPVELEEAAMIDGCSRLRSFIQVCIPVVKSGVATCAIFAFIMAWNEYFYAVIMTGNRTTTKTIFIQSFVSSSGTNWNQLCAASVIVILPILVFTTLCQKSFVRGLMGGAVKG